MKVIETGEAYQIYDDGLKTFDKLPTQVYSVEFSKDRGFYLYKYPDIEVKENRIYGVHIEKIHKVLNSFDTIKKNRNLGVILSGPKGIGKSLFAKLLAIESIKNNIPVIIVDRYISGIADFIASIDQEVLVMFDEYDKTFGGIKAADGMPNPQTELLTLFDGLYKGRKIFVITCNEIHNLNSYLINRPGRFHYHFRFDYPNAEEIMEYLHDKISKDKYSEIIKVIEFSKKVPLNYDCLRSIAFELENSGKFEDIIKDLNIVNVDSQRYKVIVHFKNGAFDTTTDYIDMFDKSVKYSGTFRCKDGYVCVEFNISDCIFDNKRGINIVAGNDIVCEACETGDKDDEELEQIGVDHVEILRDRGKDIHYAL